MVVMPTPPALETPKAWESARQTLECVGARAETADVRTFTFRAGAGIWFRYRPGQFITLALPAPGGPLHRSYTLSSSPSRPFAISVTVKRQADSVGGAWMFENVKPGTRLRAMGPMGGFFLGDPPGSRPLLFVSAGSGATPMMSMLRWCADCAPSTDITYVHVARTPEDILFRAELLALTAVMPRLRLSFVIGKGADAACRVARLDAALLAEIAPDLREREVFCCGPDGFMTAMRDGLALLGHDPAQYHQESFGAVAEPAGPVSAGGPPITFALSGIEVAGDPSRTILEAARGAGITIPSACGMGMCGTCKVRASGPVEMTHQGGIFDDEIAEGLILACCSRPRGAVEVEA